MSRKTLALGGGALFLLLGLLILIRAGSGDTPVLASTGGPEMVLNVVGGDCDDPVRPTKCSVPSGGAFSLGVDVIAGPASGYIIFLTFIDYGSDLTYQPGSPASEIVWPDLDPLVAVRTEPGAGLVVHFGITSHFPPVPVSNHTGRIVELDMVCPAALVQTQVDLLPLGDPLVGTSGSDFRDPDNLSVVPKVGSLTINCVSAPTSTPCPPGGCPTPTPINTPTDTPTPTETPTPTPTPLPPEMRLNIKGGNCDDPVRPTKCEVAAGGDSFVLSVDALGIPFDGYEFLQVYIDFDDKLIYRQKPLIEDELIWPDLSPSVQFRFLDGGDLVIGGITSILPPLPTSHFVGNIVEIDVECPEFVSSQLTVKLLPYDDPVALTFGTVFGTAFGTQQGSEFFIPVLAPLTINCIAPATPTPTITPTPSPLPPLDGDIERDCIVDLLDGQAIGFRYAHGEGDPIYEVTYDLEGSPAPDGDIDMLDIQYVFGRLGSTCESPFGIAPSPLVQDIGISLSPDSVAVTAGQAVKVSVLVDSIVSIGAYDLALGFDDSLLSYDGSSIGLFPDVGHTPLCIDGIANPTIPPRFGCLVDFAVSSGKAISGSGELVSFSFTALGTGVAEVSLIGARFGDQWGQEVFSIGVLPDAARTSAINGRIVDNFGAPISKVRVSAEPACPSPCVTSFDVSAVDGTFRVPVVEGSYHIFATKDGYISEYFNAQGGSTEPGGADLIPVPFEAKVRQIDFDLTQLGRIDGSITDNAGAGIRGAKVQASLGCAGPTLETVRTVADGSYSVIGLEPGDSYVIAATAQGYIGEFYSLSGGTTECSEAALLTADLDVVTAASALSLGRLGALQGRVTDPDGPLALVLVEAIGAETFSTRTEVDGSFAFTKVPLGTYVIRASSFRGVIYYDGAGGSSDPLEAIELEIVPDAKFGNVDLSYTPAAMSGRIIGPDGNAIKGASIELSTSSVTLKAVSDSDGDFALLDIPPDDYAFEVSIDGYVPMFWSGTGLTALPSRRQPLALDFNDNLGGFDAAMTPICEVSGSISKDTTWSPDCAYLIVGTTTVSVGVELVVEAGTVVKGNFDGWLVVEGSIRVDGTPGEPVIFTSYRDHSFGGIVNGASQFPRRGDWFGITVQASASAQLTSAQVLYAGRLAAALQLFSTDAELFDVTVRQSDAWGVWSTGTNLSIEQATIAENRNGILHDGGPFRLVDSLVHDNSVIGISLRGAGSGAEIARSQVSENRIGVIADGVHLTILDTLVVGNSQMGVDSSTVSFQMFGGAVENNGQGIVVGTTLPAVIQVRNVNIDGNAEFGIRNLSPNPGGVCVDARSNYWGSISGPSDPSELPGSCGLGSSLGTGDPTSNGVDYRYRLVAPLPTNETLPAVLLNKQPTRPSIWPGGIVEYTVALQSFNHEGLSSLRLVDQLPTEATYVLDSTRGDLTEEPDFDAGENTLTWSIPTLLEGQVIEFRYDLVIDETAADGSKLTNEISLAADGLLSVTGDEGNIIVLYPQIVDVSPSMGGSGGTVAVTIDGLHLPDVAEVYLERDDSRIYANGVEVDVPGIRLRTQFDLGDAPAGVWDLVLRPTSGPVVVAAESFTVDPVAVPSLDMTITGPGNARIGGIARYWVDIQNTGNIDVYDTWLSLFVPSGTDVTIDLGSEEFVIELLTTLEFGGASETLLTSAATFDWDTPSPSRDNGDGRDRIDVWLPLVPAGGTESLSLEVRVTESFTLEGGFTSPIGEIDRTGKLVAYQNDETSNRILNHVCQEYFDPSVQCADESDSILALFWNLGKTFCSLHPIGTCATIGSVVCGAIGFYAGLHTAFGLPFVTAAGTVVCSGLGFVLDVAIFVEPFFTNAFRAIDPNLKVAPIGVGESHFVAADAPLSYVVMFENDPDEATAPAQHVRIVDQLDPDLDWSTFSFDSASVGGVNVPLTVVGNYAHGEVVVPFDGGTLVQFEGFFDVATGLVEWTFAGPNSLDDPFLPSPFGDFLPPNENAPEGDGFVRYTVKPREGLATGTVIENFATIIFDEHFSGGSSLDTPLVFNTIDAEPPTSAVQDLLPMQANSTFNVSWETVDPSSGSGVKDYSVYVSENGGPFLPWLLFTDETSADFEGSHDSTYEFFSIARDLAGNREGLKSTGDTMTRVASCADVTGDGRVTLADLLRIAHQMNEPYDATYDLTNDGHVNARDLLVVLAQRGTSC